MESCGLVNPPKNNYIENEEEKSMLLEVISDEEIKKIEQEKLINNIKEDPLFIAKIKDKSLLYKIIILMENNVNDILNVNDIVKRIGNEILLRKIIVMSKNNTVIKTAISFMNNNSFLGRVLEKHKNSPVICESIKNKIANNLNK